MKRKRRLTPEQLRREQDLRWLANLPWHVDVPMTVERRRKEIESIIEECGGDPDRKGNRP